MLYKVHYVIQGSFLTVYLPTGFFSFLCEQVILEQTWPTCVVKQHWVPSEVFHWNRWSTSILSRYFVYIFPEQVFCVHPPWAGILCTSSLRRYFVYIFPEQVFCVHPPWAGILCTSSLSRYFVYIHPEQVFCVHLPWAGILCTSTLSRYFVYILPEQGILCMSAPSRYFVSPTDLGGWGEGTFLMGNLLSASRNNLFVSPGEEGGWGIKGWVGYTPPLLWGV